MTKGVVERISETPLPLRLFHFDLPAQNIAQVPVSPRDHARLLTLKRYSDQLSDKKFFELPEMLHDGDVLVVNQTEVIAARLRLRKKTGGAVELLLLRPHDGGDLQTSKSWIALGRPAKSLLPGTLLTTTSGDQVTVGERRADEFIVSGAEPLWDLMQRCGEVPLPPYIERSSGLLQSDVRDYQTMFARKPGAVAAPTASLHFTETLCEQLGAKGVFFAPITLHVGAGTFLPIRPENAADIRSHKMHPEWYEIPQESATIIENAKQRGRRVIAVGTTSTRALESWKALGQTQGETQLFIYPGYTFRMVDALITNFHLPESTLLALVAAFGGTENVLRAYSHAITQGYRFYSYGDAMLIC